MGMEIFPDKVFNTRDPIILGVRITDGILKINAPIVVPSKDSIYLGRVRSIQDNHKEQESAKAGQEVAISIEPEDEYAQRYFYGRHFNWDDLLYTRITRQSIDVLKQNFRSELSKDIVKLIVKMKKIFDIM